MEFFGRAIDRARIRQERNDLVIARAAQFDSETYQSFLKERYPDG